MRIVALTLVLGCLAVSEAWAQIPEDREAIAEASLVGGALTPVMQLPDGSRFHTGAAFGGSLTLFPDRAFGVRASYLRASTPGGEAVTEFMPVQSPTVHYYTADVQYRLSAGPLEAMGWRPYVFAGAGVKNYDFVTWTDEDDSSHLAGLVGAGLNYRYGRLGIQAEARSVFSKYDHLDEPTNQGDLIYTLGLTMRF